MVRPYHELCPPENCLWCAQPLDDLHGEIPAHGYCDAECAGWHLVTKANAGTLGDIDATLLRDIWAIVAPFGRRHKNVSEKPERVRA
jgi:hypothetical protein